MFDTLDKCSPTGLGGGGPAPVTDSSTLHLAEGGFGAGVGAGSGAGSGVATAGGGPFTPSASIIKDLFGGVQAIVMKCMHCNRASCRFEHFVELTVGFPRRFTPITDIVAVVVPRLPVRCRARRCPLHSSLLVRSLGLLLTCCVFTCACVFGLALGCYRRVMGKMVTVKVPEGFERVQGDLNKNREGSPYIALCVSRAPGKVPISEIAILTQPNDAKVLARTVGVCKGGGIAHNLHSALPPTSTLPPPHHHHHPIPFVAGGPAYSRGLRKASSKLERGWEQPWGKGVAILPPRRHLQPHH